MEDVTTVDTNGKPVRIGNLVRVIDLQMHLFDFLEPNEIEDIRSGKHGARSAKQAIAIGLSKARRAGVRLPPPPRGRTSEKARRSARRAYKEGRRGVPVNPRRSRATSAALKREGRAAASHTALSRQAHAQARQRTAAERSAIARKAARTRRARS